MAEAHLPECEEFVVDIVSLMFSFYFRHGYHVTLTNAPQVNRDDFISRWRNTNYPRDEILKRVIG